MASRIMDGEYETGLEGLGELESEWEGELEGEEFQGTLASGAASLPGESEWEGEYESEEFFSRLAGMAQQAMQNPTLRRAGIAAANAAVSGLGDVGRAAQSLTTDVLEAGVRGLIPQSEFESEWEWEWESAAFANPVRRIYSEALMEHLGHAAAQAKSEAEAEAFVGALIPLAARVLPKVAPQIMRAAPHLIRGIAGAAKALRSSPTTRPLLRTLPTVARNTAASMARQAAQGQLVTPQTAVRTLAQQTARMVSNPQQSLQAYQRSRALDQRYHQATRTGPRASSH
jgi:hypothetical protein